VPSTARCRPCPLFTSVGGNESCRWAAGSSRRSGSARGCGGSGRAAGRCQRSCCRRRTRPPRRGAPPSSPGVGRTPRLCSPRPERPSRSVGVRCASEPGARRRARPTGRRGPGGDHARLAEQPTGEPGGDHIAGVELRGAQPGQQLVVVEENHHRGAHAPGLRQPIGREPLQETTESLAHQPRWRRARTHLRRHV
jgi:hypothetical protein